MKRLPEILLVLMIAMAPFTSPGAAFAAETGQPVRAGGLEIFYGVVPAEILLGHPGDHEERRMHGGIPRGRGQHHVIVSLFDGKTRQRVEGATVTARVGEIGLGSQEKKLEPMQFGGTATYGNYFSMAAPGPYRVELVIRRASGAQSVKATFEYSHPRR